MAIIGFVTPNFPTILAGQIQEAVYSTQSAFPLPRLRVPLPRAGALRRFRSIVNSNSLDAPLVLHVLIGGVVTALTITYPAGITGGKAFDVFVPAAAGNVVSFKMDASAAGVGNAEVNGAVEFVP